MMNERKTEDIVDSRLRKKGYYRDKADLMVEKQRSDITRIQTLLNNASKRGTGVGRPEFIIHSNTISDFLIVMECKADPQKHISDNLDRPAEYAVDGALHYASFLSNKYDVLAIAISGQNESELRISHYLHLRGEPKAVVFSDFKEIEPFMDYYDGFLKSGIKFRQDYNTLIDYGRVINNQLQVKKIKEAQRGFLISGILIALQNKAFKDSFRLQRTAKQLAKNLVETISSEFENARLPEDRRVNLRQAFSFIDTLPSLLEDKDFFVNLIDGVEENVNSFMRTYEYYDTIGQFYVEFLKYANNEKGLGIVLTPSHIADLFTELADVNKNSVVFDNCCGTAGLLIAAMKAMILDAKSNKRIKKRIRDKQLFGMEFQGDIFALAVSNMILHGDGKTNMYRGDCFENASDIISPNKPTVGLLNPPYKNKANKEDKEELEFVLNNLDILEPDGKCVAIVPITCATAPDGKIYEIKRTILERHTLEAVMSMPIELFHNSKTNVVTCVMIFTSHRPHPKSKKTWFGYCRNDGFVKTKHRGRTDSNDDWEEIKNVWVSAFRNREIIDNFSVMREVRANDEWCAEAYLETDYSLINENQLKTTSKRYFLNNLMMMHEMRIEEGNEINGEDKVR